MKQLVLISGKGGTGKTSIAASFAVMAKNAVTADCDVDAADLHLILKPDVIEQHEFRSGRLALIDKSKCTPCGECFKACRFDAVRRISDTYIIDELSCEGCGVCRVVCPSDAITMQEKVSGHWFVSKTRCGPMVYAHLKAGEENSGKLVSAVRKKALEIAKQSDAGYLIIDGPPGIGCPVIASIGGVDLALIITEPTQSGMHDFMRVAELSKHFGIETVVCINKFDLNLENTEKIGQMCEKMNITVVGKIPYDLEITNAMMQGLSVVELDKGAASVEIKDMWKKISNM